ncbi:hypothetical protein PSA5_06780 [Pseudomonas syringae pv. actinidiae]|nr:hypothetical protein PSA5_06780 [Pseudomonas syringae pv. actinidiae]
MPIREIRHPLIRHKLGLMRRADISTKNFRELAQEVGALLTYEATADLTLESYDIQAGPEPCRWRKSPARKSLSSRSCVPVSACSTACSA